MSPELRFLLKFAFPNLLPMVFAVMVGSILVGTSLRWLWQAQRTERWRETTGTILSCTVKKMAVSRRHHPYQAAIEYEYRVGRSIYRSNRLFFGQQWITEPYVAAEARCSKYRSGTQVTVYYDTKQPSEAVLEPVPHGALYALLLIGSLFLVIGLLLGILIPWSALNTCGLSPDSVPSSLPQWCKQYL